MADRLTSLVRSGRYFGAAAEAHLLLASLDDDDSSNKAHVHFWLAKAHMGMGKVHAAHHAFIIALECAKRCDDWTLIGRIRLDQGVNYRRMGDTHEAIRSLESFLDDLPVYPELEEFMGAVKHNLGLATRQNRELDLAIRNYEEAVAYSRQHKKVEWAIMSLQNLSWVLFETRRFAEAEDRLSQAAALITASAPGLQRNQILTTAYGSLMQGGITKAADACNDLLSDPENRRTDIEIWAFWISAECLRLTGELDKAHELAQQAQQAAIELGADPRLLNYIQATINALKS